MRVMMLMTITRFIILIDNDDDNYDNNNDDNNDDNTDDNNDKNDNSNSNKVSTFACIYIYVNHYGA